MSTLEHLKAYVVAGNKVLKDAVHSMDVIILLRNSHPAYRPDFARALLNEGKITKEQSAEFIKIVTRHAD